MRYSRKYMRKLIKEEVRRTLLMEGSGPHDHTSNLKPIQNVSMGDLETGDFIKLTYPGEKGPTDRELLVMNPSDGKLIHFIDISYLSERTIAKIFANLHDRMSPMAAQMMNKTFPQSYEAGPILGGHDEFYYNVVKPKIPKALKAYRTYRKDRVEDELITRMRYKPTLSGDLSDFT